MQTVSSNDVSYSEFETIIANRVAAVQGPLFKTDAQGLFAAYLGGIAEEHRQHYNCWCCHHFIREYGCLVTISDDGKTTPALWNRDEIPEFFKMAVIHLYDRVVRAKITGVFINDEKEWGKAETPEIHNGQYECTWSHLHGTPTVPLHTGKLKTAGQVAAERNEDFKMLSHALGEIPIEAAVQAVRVLEADALDRSEKTLGVAKWFLALHEKIAGKKGQIRSNLIWKAAATAPAGWCHIRSSMIGTLLQDIVAGLSYEVIAARWAKKIHPLQYMRPTTIKGGTITQANKMLETLEATGALKRRYATAKDVLKWEWQPSEVVAEQKPQGGVFDHLRKESPNKIKELVLPAQSITWEKFKSTVLLTAKKIELRVPGGNAAFYTLVTAVDETAPFILQWSNHVSWFFRHMGIPAQDFGLVTNAWTPVKGVMLKPCYWEDETKFTHQGGGIFFALEGAVHLHHKSGGGFFPECLRNEYHSIRSVMEQYAQRAEIFGKDQPDQVNGLSLDGTTVYRIRVNNNQEYDLHA